MNLGPCFQRPNNFVKPRAVAKLFCDLTERGPQSRFFDHGFGTLSVWGSRRHLDKPKGRGNVPARVAWCEFTNHASEYVSKGGRRAHRHAGVQRMHQCTQNITCIPLQSAVTRMALHKRKQACKTARGFKDSTSAARCNDVPESTAHRAPRVTQRTGGGKHDACVSAPFKKCQHAGKFI